MFPSTSPDKFFTHLRRIILTALVVAWISGDSTAWCAGFHIQINAGSGLSSNQDAFDAFTRAAAEWESRITNDVTVYINADLVSDLGAGIIGESGFISYTSDYSDINLDYTAVRDAMAVRAGRPGNAVLAALPTAALVTANLPSGATLINSSIGIVRANQRVLGLLSSVDTRADQLINFSAAFAFDYNRLDADGVGSGKIDFQTAAAHEIGHALGFMSDVDDFDRFPGITEDNLTTLDLFRFPTANKPTTLAEFTSFARELRPGAASVLTDTNVSYAMSTGQNQGDGRQASHWQDDFYQFAPGVFLTQPTIGIMDPTLGYGVFETVAESDLRAMELIGYDVLQVPEPRVTLFLLCAAIVLASPRGLRQRAVILSSLA